MLDAAIKILREETARKEREFIGLNEEYRQARIIYQGTLTTDHLNEIRKIYEKMKIIFSQVEENIKIFENLNLTYDISIKMPEKFDRARDTKLGVVPIDESLEYKQIAVANKKPGLDYYDYREHDEQELDQEILNEPKIMRAYGQNRIKNK